MATAARSFPGESVSGDAWRVDRDGQRCRIAVVDGLGHGHQAAIAAHAAMETLAANPGLDPAAALAICHQAPRPTRGAALAIVSVDMKAQRLTFAGIGNVEARVLSSGVEKRLSSVRGILGSVFPRIIPEERPLENGWRLVMHTDGVRARFRITDLTNELATPQEVAGAILTNWGREADDATVVVAGVESAGI